MSDKRARRDVAEVLEVLDTPADAETYRDLVGPAVYRLEPTPATVISCLACHHVGLVPSIPKVPRLVWTCAGCNAGIALEPPPIVWVEGSRVLAMPSRPS